MKYLLIAALLVPAYAVAQAPQSDVPEDVDVPEQAQGVPDNKRPADVTMEVVDEDDLPDEVFARIELPEEAADAARENAQRGLDTANDARENRREFGERIADEARERGGADEARDRARDDVSRGALDNVPDDVKDNIPDEAKERARRRGGNRDGG